MKTVGSLLVSSLVLSIALSGCKESKASPEKAMNASVLATASSTETARSSRQTSQIVFIDKEHGCACTQKRVDGSWSALQAALNGKSPITIERLHADTQSEQVDPYNKMRPILVLPALYFMDASGGLIELLQGEVSSAQITAVLGADPK